jgi:hypothetical protein
MKLRPRPIDITALQWNGHDENPELACFVQKYDLSGEKYLVLGYESILFCCGRQLQEHGMVKSPVPLGGGVVCPGMWIVTEVNLRTSVLERVRAMTMDDIKKEFEGV